MTDPIRQASQPGSKGVSRKRILVVDRDEFVCNLVSKVLTGYMGLEVFQARDSGEAIAAALTGQYDGAIIDLALARTSGAEAIRAIRTMRPRFPIVAMTGPATEKNLNSVKGLGVIGILQKPFRIAALVEKIKEILSASEVSAVEE